MSTLDGEIKGIDDAAVVQKYKDASVIANKVLAKLITTAAAGATIADLCESGDVMILEEVAKIYQGKKGKKIEKGIGFPTTVSVNNIAGHFAPVRGENDAALQDGDVVKIELGVHVDGFLAVAGETILVGGSGALTGRAADAALAAYYAGEAIVRKLRPGVDCSELTAISEKVCEAYDCQPLANILCHNTTQYLADGEKSFLLKRNPERKPDPATVAENDVWNIDIVVSTGAGKAKETEDKTTIFGPHPEQHYKLDLKAARQVYSEIQTKSAYFPFHTRAIEHEKKNFGISSCVKHGLLSPYPVLAEKDGEFVAVYKFTALVFPTSTSKLTGRTQPPAATSDKKIEDQEILDLLATSLKPKKNKKKKKADA